MWFLGENRLGHSEYLGNDSRAYSLCEIERNGLVRVLRISTARLSPEACRWSHRAVTQISLSYRRACLIFVAGIDSVLVGRVRGIYSQVFGLDGLMVSWSF